MARWKARVKFLLSVIELLFLSLTVKALQGKMCPDSLLSGGGRSVRANISAGRGRPWGIFFGFYKTRLILLSDSAICTVLRAIVLTQYRRVTDGRTDRRNCRIYYSACNASTAACCKNRHQKGSTILDFNEARDDRVTAASAGPYTTHLHLAPYR